MASALTNPWAAAQAALLHIMNTGVPNATPPGSSPPVTPPGSSDAATGGPGASVPSGAANTGAGMNYSGIKYDSNLGPPGPDNAWQAANAGPWNFFTGGPYAPNAGQTDQFGNVYNPVNNSLWGGQYVDPKSLPGSSTVNAQLWGGPTSDSPPAWLQKIVQDAANMSPGAERTARIQHIMSSLIDPKSGANQHDLGYAERMFGITG